MPTYSFDETVNKKTGKKKHVHMLDGKPILGTTTVLDVIAKPALIQWAANLGTAEAFMLASSLALLMETEEEDGLEQLLDLANAISKYEKIDTDACHELDKQFPLFKKARLAHREKKDAAADWGTLVHKAIEVWIKTKAIPTAVTLSEVNHILLPEHLTAIENFVGWATKNNVEFLQSEKGIYSETWQIGGIVDMVVKIDGKLLVGDLKTSSGIWESYWLQTAAYAKMMMEMGMYPRFDGMVIVNCKKDGTIDVEERKDVAGNIKCYEAAIVLHNRLN